MGLAFLRGLEKAPTFLVPIINPPFADNSPHLSHRGCLFRRLNSAWEGFAGGRPAGRYEPGHTGKGNGRGGKMQFQLIGSPSGYLAITSAGTSKTLPQPPSLCRTWGLVRPRFRPRSIR
jgi:hypothetical protein